MDNYEKKYKEALERARSIFNEEAVPTPSAKGACEYIFPELAESEKTRKEIIHFLDTAENQMTLEQYISCENRWIPWLEKQGEQKPVEIEETELRSFNEGYAQGVISEKSKPVEWSTNDEFVIKILNTVCDEYLRISTYKGTEFRHEVIDAKTWLKSLKDRYVPQPKQEWNEEDENHRKDAILAIQEYRADCIKKYGKDPAWADCVDWLKSLKNRVQPQPEQEWSEEEIENCAREAEDNNCIILAKHIRQLKSLRPQKQILYDAVRLVFEENLTPYKDGNQWCFLLGGDIQSGICGFGNTILDAAVEFYKEYDSYKGKIDEIQRPQKQWKPSEEQIEALRDAISDIALYFGEESLKCKYIVNLRSLYNDLKAL